MLELKRLWYDRYMIGVKKKWHWVPVGFVLIVLMISAYLLPRSPIWPQERIVLGLPYHSDDPPSYMEPMGETINHPKPQTPYGHPGIDFKWDHVAEIISVASGKVTSIDKIVDHDTELFNIQVRAGKYSVSYDELDKVAEGITVGTSINKGDVIGYIHPEFLQMHWDFGYSLPLGEPLCPNTYFDEQSFMLIERHWQEAWYKHRDQFPDICSGDFANRN